MCIVVSTTTFVMGRPASTSTPQSSHVYKDNSRCVSLEVAEVSRRSRPSVDLGDGYDDGQDVVVQRHFKKIRKKVPLTCLTTEARRTCISTNSQSAPGSGSPS